RGLGCGFLNAQRIVQQPFDLGLLILDRGFEVTPTATQSVLLVCTGIATLGGCWILQTYVAARRLSSPESDTIKNLIPAREPSAYRPPVAVIGTERPGLLRALLWQQWRQAGLPCLAITVITMIGTFGFLSSPRGFFRDVGPVIITLGACWLGSLVFYGENVLRRRVFFADRGYSPSLVWFTRLFWPGLGCLALTAIVLFHQFLAEQVNAHAPAIAIGLLVNSFAMGQFVGQWRSQRPILTFFAAPVYVLLMGILPVYVLTMYSPAMRLLALAMAPVLLIASWRLTERWLTDNNGFAFTWRAAAFSMAAIALPILLAFGDRIRTTPPRNSDLRLSINEAYRDYVQAKDGDLHLGNLLAGSLAAFETHGFASEFDTVSDTEQRQRLDSELDADSIGDFVSVDDLLYLLNSPGTPAKLQESAVRVLLHWATKTREVARSGQLQLYALEQLAERGEARAVQWLFAARSSNRHDLEDLQELVRLIPDASLRQESRRNALLFEWNLYSTSEWEVKQADRTYFRKSFAGTVIGSRVGWLFFERRRADRYVDEFTKLTLAQIHRPPAVSSPEWNRRERLWEEISDLERDVRSPTVLMSTWSSDYEDQILQLRASVNGLMPHRDRRNRR
ncbi:MAG: hypothetical protein AB8B91_25245, partial [Rubripirellula sp.]